MSRISDVVSVGQQLSLMCIGQDVRGNIKLSLKATLPRPRSQTNNLAVESVPSMKQAPSVWAATGDVSNGQENHSPLSEELPVSKYEVNVIKSSTSSSPPVVVRSVAECDEEEKSTGLVQNSKTTSEPIGGLKSDRKSVQNTLKTSKSLSQKEGDIDEKEQNIASHTHTSNNLNNKEDPVTAKSLKLGTKVTAKVYQIRTGGLVLDLGGGLRGMYRFEVCVILSLYGILTFSFFCLCVVIDRFPLFTPTLFIVFF